MSDVHNQYRLDHNKQFWTKDALETLIEENGGAVVQRIPDPSPSRVVIASKWQGDYFTVSGWIMSL